MEKKYTKGPWYQMGMHKQHDVVTIATGDQKQIATVQSLRDGKNNEQMNIESDANAALISAAPDLLEALTELLESYKMYVRNPGQSEYVINAEAAITKATSPSSKSAGIEKKQKP